MPWLGSCTDPREPRGCCPATHPGVVDQTQPGHAPNLSLAVSHTHAAMPAPQNGQEHEVDAVLRRKFEGRIRDIEIVEREDLDLVGAA